MKAYVSTDDEIDTSGHANGDERFELETDSRTVRGLRSYVRKRPITMLGVAFGGGLVAAAIVSSRRSADAEQREVENGTHARRQPRRGHDFMENVKGAVLGAASIQALAFLGDVLEGLEERYAERQLRKDRATSRTRTGEEAR